MPASSAARTHWVATSFSTCEPCVSQLPKVISEILKPLFPRYLNSMGFTVADLPAGGKASAGFALLGLRLGPLMVLGRRVGRPQGVRGNGRRPGRETSEPVSSMDFAAGIGAFLKAGGTVPSWPFRSVADSTSGATANTSRAGAVGLGSSRTETLTAGAASALARAAARASACATAAAQSGDRAGSFLAGFSGFTGLAGFAAGLAGFLTGVGPPAFGRFRLGAGARRSEQPASHGHDGHGSQPAEAGDDQRGNKDEEEAEEHDERHSEGPEEGQVEGDGCRIFHFTSPCWPCRDASRQERRATAPLNHTDFFPWTRRHRESSASRVKAVMGPLPASPPGLRVYSLKEPGRRGPAP